MRFMVLLGALLAATPLWAGEAVKASKTLDNLQAAFNGESNAQARYTAFAEKADKDGYEKTASLFRAAAKAESIHAAGHAKVIQKMGAEPKAVVAKVKVESTAKNVATALKGEMYERDTMYPGFIETATSEKNFAAVKAFKFALSAEKEHAALYAEVKADLSKWKAGKQDFMVCPTCGKTVRVVDFKRCPVCNEKASNYLKVS